ncbi:type VII secretion-associated serine protease mycosin [Kribbella sp. ALI-6-A]|nr:type VII secretion-associated serine protease mycosin [Kribbella sp. ALI-6-A]
MPLVAALPASAAPPSGLCPNADPGRPVVRQLPWAQQMLDADRVWARSTGSGVLVGVVDSGVDADHPQLRGKVRRGEDFYSASGTLRADFDCDSHGTAVAGIIAATPTGGIGFHGVAPDARILPVRVTERAANGTDPNQISPVALAEGIRYAADQRVKVLNLSIAGTVDYPAVRSAVAYAQARDVLVIAAVGNNQREDGVSLPSYPAAYDGVLGVGAIDIDGQRTSSSQAGPYVDLVAPGGQVLAPTRRGGHTYVTGTSFATPFVSGTAALVRAAWPRLTARQVQQRLIATASPARGGGARWQYGAGVVDPYRAVGEGLSTTRPRIAVAVASPAPEPAVVQAAAERHRLMSVAWGKSLFVGAAALVVLALALVLPHGVRRGWVPARGAQPRADRERDDPPDQLFLLPAPPAER